jgi:hypothetical protein
MNKAVPLFYLVLIAQFSEFARPANSQSSNLTQQVLIGGRSPDSPNLFLEKWAPLFEGYLTSSVGSQFQPPIVFKLVPVGYTPSTEAADMLKDGKLDFICKPHATCLEREQESVLDGEREKLGHGTLQL